MTKMMPPKRIEITSCSYSQSELYTVMGEDSLLYVFDTGCVTEDAQGTRWMHKAFIVKGFGRDNDGVAHPNRCWEIEANAFVEKVMARGTIDPTYWEVVPAYDPIAAEAYNLRCEADERAWGVL
jgi:hypothetical protein